MSQQTGEDELGLHRILEVIRVGSIAVLGLHFYYFACPACVVWQGANPVLDRLMSALADTGIFSDLLRSKVIALGLLGVSLLGARGRKMPEYRAVKGGGYVLGGMGIYFGSGLVGGAFYVLSCSVGFFLVLHGGAYLSRVVWQRGEPDVFNRLHESFPQEERRLENDHSIHFRGRYAYGREIRDCYVNISNPFRGTVLFGSPGSGKTWYVIEPMIRQYIQKGFAMLVYDFKYDDLSRLAYNCFLRYAETYAVPPAFYSLVLDDVCRSHRCNPLHPSTLNDISDAGECARTVLLGMNPEALSRPGEFFNESSINYVTALIWFLRLYEDGKYCTWPHVIELAQTDYKELFTILCAEPQLRNHITPFVNALREAPEQLSGQIATAAIHLARLTSPAIYYMMSGDDFSLKLNDPLAPKILAIGGNPQKVETYGPVISAYINTVNRLANRKGMYPLSEIFEEFGTVSVHTISRTIATGRSNKIAVTLCLQNVDQLRLLYGKEFAGTVVNACGNIISGQVSGETAQLLADRFGKIRQDRESFTSTYADTSVTRADQLDAAVPVSRIASLSAGEFVGMVADDPGQRIELKLFSCRLVNDPAGLAAEAAAFKSLPEVRRVTDGEVMENFLRIRKEVEGIVVREGARIERSPEGWWVR